MATRVRLLDIFLCRLGTLPTDCVDDLCARRTAEVVRSIEALDADIRQLRESVSDDLYALVGAATATTQRRLLVRARRDLYNSRLPVPRALAVLESTATGDARDRLTTYWRLIARRNAASQALEDTFRDERASAHRKLMTLVKNAAFQKGLLLSSATLHANQSRLGGEGNSLELSGREARVERSLLRYVLRTATKATPFATFCALLPGRIDHDQSAGIAGVTLRGRLLPLKVFPRINKSVSGILAPHLLRDRQIRKALRVRLNPTLRDDPDHYSFLTGSMFHEAFRRVARTPSVDLVAGMLPAAEGSSFGAFVEQLAAHDGLECTADEAERFAEELLKIGMISLDLGIKQQDPDWDQSLLRELGRCNEELVALASQVFRSLREAMVKLPDAPAEEWPRLIDQANRNVIRLVEKAGANGGGELPALHIDATADATAGIRRDADWDVVASDIGRYLTAVIRLAAPRVAQANMRHFFELRYGASAEVPLLWFYEDYYREHFKSYLARLQAATVKGHTTKVQGDLINPFGLEFIRDIARANHDIGHAIHAAWSASPDAEEVTVSLDQIESIAHQISPPNHRSISVAMLATPCGRTEGEGSRLYVKDFGITLGYGHLFSRWLHILPEWFSRELLSSNEQGAHGRYLAEISGDSHHNANLHPLMVPWEISYPNTDTSVPLEHRLSPTELTVSVDPGDAHALVLRHTSSDALVVPLDLGFLKADLRPPLFRLLADFSPPNQYRLMIPDLLDATGRVGGHPPQERTIVYRPRIAVGRVVVARRRWTVPAALIPSRSSGQTDAEMFGVLLRWQRSTGLPAQCYARIESYQPALREAGNDKASQDDQGAGTLRAMVNDRKPQFVDFENPLMVGLLESVVRRAKAGSVQFEERLPGRGALPRLGEHLYASEVALQAEIETDGLP